MRIHLQGFIRRHGRKQVWVTLANRYINGKTESNPRASIGLRSANNIQQGKAERLSRYTSRYQNTRTQAKQDYND